MKVKAIVTAVRTAEHFVDVLRKQEEEAERLCRDMLKTGLAPSDPQVKELQIQYNEAKDARQEMEICLAEFFEIDFGGIAHE